MKADVRAFTPEELDRVEAGAARLATSPNINGVTISSSLQRSFPAWPRAASTDAVFARATRLYSDLGRTLTAAAVGSSADVKFAAETGTPATDGFGMEGGGAQGPDDNADIASLVPRAYVLSRLWMETGRSPK